MAQLPTVSISGVGDVYARLYGVHTESWLSPDAPCPKAAAQVETYILTLPFAIGASPRARFGPLPRAALTRPRPHSPPPPPLLVRAQAACRWTTRSWA